MRASRSTRRTPRRCGRSTRTHPDSSLATALFAESLMNLEPWKHWTPDGNAGRPHAGARRSAGTRARAVARPSDAVPPVHSRGRGVADAGEGAARRRIGCATLLPGIGHLVHMPSHIDVLLGDYDAVIAANQRGDRGGRRIPPPRGAATTSTRFTASTTTTSWCTARCSTGRASWRCATARKIPAASARGDAARSKPTSSMRSSPRRCTCSCGSAGGRRSWPSRSRRTTCRCRASIWHYARGLAYAATGRVAEAEAEQRAFAEVAATVPETSFLFQNPSRSILGVAEAMLAGEIAYRKGEFDAAFAHLQRGGAARRCAQLRRAVGLDAAGAARAGGAAPGAGPGRPRRRPCTAPISIDTRTTRGRCTGWPRASTGRARRTRRRSVAPSSKTATDDAT